MNSCHLKSYIRRDLINRSLLTNLLSVAWTGSAWGCVPASMPCRTAAASLSCTDGSVPTAVSSAGKNSGSRGCCSVRRWVGSLRSCSLPGWTGRLVGVCSCSWRKLGRWSSFLGGLESLYTVKCSINWSLCQINLICKFHIMPVNVCWLSWVIFTTKNCHRSISSVFSGITEVNILVTIIFI